LGASPWGRHRLANFGSAKSSSVVNRLMMWKVATNLWKEAPLQGVGLAVYRPLYPKIQAQILEAEPDKGWNYVVTWLPHQNYLYWLCETGLIGLGLFLAYWGLCLYRGWRRAAQGEALALGALLAIAGLLGAGFLNTFSNIPPTAVGAALCLGFLASAPAVAVAQKHRAALGASSEAWVVAVIVAFLLGKAGGIELVANRLTREAGRMEKREDRVGAARLDSRAASLEVANFTQQALVGVRFNEAENLRQTGRLAEAIEAYRKDLGPNPWAPEVHNMLGASLGQYGAQTRNAAMVYEGAEHLRTAAWLNPGYTTALLNLGGSYMTLGNLTGAAQAWTEVLHYEPANKEAQGYLQMLKARR
jgi:Flp pilus assembly protein TadD